MNRLERFVGEIDLALDATSEEADILDRARAAMRELVAVDDWLPDEMAKPNPQYYTQYLLHRDAHARFSVVSFVWGPGQKTPIHDHTVWGVIGMLRGSELAQGYTQTPAGMAPTGPVETLMPGHVAAVSPATGDIHEVRNAFDDRVSISIHVYGADIGAVRRHVFEPQSGAVKEFVSGYSNTVGNEA
ncbi:cysteine dioxygenase [Cupriavidus sp. TA19]|uniref:cysteine dioxygenase family protein n=1 Tax=Cupriavidus sp. TA19 TaxID=701108 RepID=UPI0027294776|nr:cysteine dioxygenase [Cupriavidus sp. TA19]GLC91798.1 cysteine dioxygenase [Cupriavidus sp. TA19]